MDPDRIDYLKDLYPTLQFSESIYSGQKMIEPYSCLNSELLDLPTKVRAQISQAYGTVQGHVSDYLDIFQIGFRVDSHNIKSRNDLLKTFLARTQLKSALFSWYTKEGYPMTPSQFTFFNLKFRDNLYKKVHAQKTSYLKSVEDIIGPHKFEIINEKDLGILTPIEQEKLNMNRIRAMSKYNLVDQVSQSKAEVIAIRDELDKNLMVHAIDIIEKEYAALSSALDREASNISAYIHPFQQFTSV